MQLSGWLPTIGDAGSRTPVAIRSYTTSTSLSGSSEPATYLVVPAL